VSRSSQPTFYLYPIQQITLHTWHLTLIRGRQVCNNDIHTLTFIIINKKYYFKAINLIVQNTIRENNNYTCVFWIKNFSLGNGSLAGDIAHYVEAKLWKIICFPDCFWYVPRWKSKNLEFWGHLLCVRHFMLSHFLSFFEASTIILFLQIQEKDSGTLIKLVRVTQLLMKELIPRPIYLDDSQSSCVYWDHIGQGLLKDDCQVPPPDFLSQ